MTDGWFILCGTSEANFKLIGPFDSEEECQQDARGTACDGNHAYRRIERIEERYRRTGMVWTSLGKNVGLWYPIPQVGVDNAAETCYDEAL